MSTNQSSPSTSSPNKTPERGGSRSPGGASAGSIVSSISFDTTGAISVASGRVLANERVAAHVNTQVHNTLFGARAILAPNAPTLSSDPETCHPDVSLSWADHLATKTGKGLYRSVRSKHPFPIKARKINSNRGSTGLPPSPRTTTTGGDPGTTSTGSSSTVTTTTTTTTGSPMGSTHTTSTPTSTTTSTTTSPSSSSSSVAKSLTNNNNNNNATTADAVSPSLPVGTSRPPPVPSRKKSLLRSISGDPTVGSGLSPRFATPRKATGKPSPNSSKVRAVAGRAGNEALVWGSANVAYVEFRWQSQGVATGGVAVGAMDAGADLKKQVGTSASSIGFHSTGKLFVGGKWVPYSSPWFVGDRVSMAIAAIVAPQKGDVHLTLEFWVNGLSKGSFTLRRPLPSPQPYLYPGLSLFALGSEVLACLSSEDFKYGQGAPTGAVGLCDRLAQYGGESASVYDTDLGDGGKDEDSSFSRVNMMRRVSSSLSSLSSMAVYSERSYQFEKGDDILEHPPDYLLGEGDDEGGSPLSAALSELTATSASTANVAPPPLRSRSDSFTADSGPSSRRSSASRGARRASQPPAFSPIIEAVGSSDQLAMDDSTDAPELTDLSTGLDLSFDELTEDDEDDVRVVKDLPDDKVIEGSPHSSSASTAAGTVVSEMTDG